MDLEFKNSFLANTTAKTDNTQSLKNVKSNEKPEGSSFEAKLELKRRETSRNEESQVKENRDIKDKEKTREKISGKTQKSQEKVKTKQSGEKTEAVDKKVVESASKEVKKENVASDEEAAASVSSEAETIAASSNEPAPGILSDEQNIAAMQQIAKVLGVTPEKVQASFEKLGLTPEDLKLAENMKALIMDVKGIEDPAEMLKIPELSTVIKEIDSIVEAALEEAKILKSQTKATAEGKTLAAQIPQQENLTVTNETLKEGATEGQSGTAVAAGEVHTGEIEEKKSVNTEIKTVTAETEAAEMETETAKTGAATQNKETESEKDSAHSDRRDQPQRGQRAAMEQVRNELPDAKESPVPVVINRAGETVIEIGGKIVSRAQNQATTQQATDVMNQIVEKMKIDFKPISQEIKINLRPQDLGNLQIRVVTESGRVTAEIVAENSKVKELIEENINTLKDALKGQGIDIGELSVSVGQQENDERMNQFYREQGKSQGRMSQILKKLEQEDEGIVNNPAAESETVGNSVDFTA